MEPDAPSTLGDLLRHYRALAHLTQEELAARSGLTPQGISLLERGERRRPQVSTVHRLAEALVLTPDEQARFVAAAKGRYGRGVVHLAADSAVDRDRPPLVGRAREMALLERHLAVDQTPDASPRVLLLAGEPGIGKSRLLYEATRFAVRHGWSVLEGGCQRRSGQEPYAPLLGALKEYIRRRQPTRLRADLRGCAWLVRLLPEVADGPIEPAPAWTLPPEQERRLMFDAVSRFLTNVAGPAGTLLVLDDLQWASPDALDLLAALVHSAALSPAESPDDDRDPRGALRVVGAYRATEIVSQTPLALLLGDLARVGLAAQHTLGPLSAEDAARLLAVLLDGMEAAPDRLATVERTVQRAGGLPFYLVSCARALRAGALDEGAAERILWDVAQSIHQRVSALPTPVQEALQVAAVIGRTISRAVLTAVTAQPEEDALTALDAACQARMLEEEGPDAYHFLHDVTREVIEADLSAARRGALHRRVAEALERQPGESMVETLAYHYGWSGAHDKAVWYLERAGDKARARHANAAAASYYRAAMQRLDGLARSGEAAHVREKLGAVLTTMGRYDEALVVLDQAIVTYRAAGDPEGAGRATAQLGWTHAERGTPQEGVARIQAALAALEERGPSHPLAALYAALAHLYYVGGEYSRQLEVAGRAVDLARAIGDEKILTTAGAERGCALSLMGRGDEALAAMEEARALAEALGDAETLVVALHFLAIGYGWRGDFDALRRHVERGVEIADRVGNPTHIAGLRLMRGIHAFYMGAWAEARADFDRALTATRHGDASRSYAYVLFHLGLLSLGEGDWDEASHYCDESIAILERRGDLQGLRPAVAFRAWCDLLQGHPEAARARLAPLAGRPDVEEREVAFILPFVAWAHLELGDVAAAETTVMEALRRARATHSGLALTEALPVAAMVAIRRAVGGGRAASGGGPDGGAEHTLPLRRGAPAAPVRRDARPEGRAGTSAGAAGGGPGDLWAAGRAQGRGTDRKSTDASWLI